MQSLLNSLGSIELRALADHYRDVANRADLRAAELETRAKMKAETKEWTRDLQTIPDKLAAKMETGQGYDVAALDLAHEIGAPIETIHR